MRSTGVLDGCRGPALFGPGPIFGIAVEERPFGACPEQAKRAEGAALSIPILMGL